MPLHPTTMVGLKRYLEHRGVLEDDHRLVSLRGHGIRSSGIVTVFLCLVRAMEFYPGPGKPGPRIHDLRHGFAVRVLESCSGDRTVVDANMLALMTYMGHGQIDSTYWYPHATPHMLARIAETAEAFTERELMTPQRRISPLFYASAYLSIVARANIPAIPMRTPSVCWDFSLLPRVLP